jgi:hypothetical protein
MPPVEVWRPVVGYEGVYEVSDRGNVRRIKPGIATRPGKVLKPFPHSEGYLRVSLSVNCKAVNKYIHVLVAEAFYGPCPEGMEVNHKNTEKTDNQLSNLEFMTHGENTLHAKLNGRYANRPRRPAR